MRQVVGQTPLMLNSWKEIASYLDRGVRTVQRWERELRLPVHRIGRSSRSPVFALSTELNFWIATAEVPEAGRARRLLEQREARAIAREHYHRLKSDYPALVRSVAENAARLKRQIEVLERRVSEIKSYQRSRNNSRSE